MQQQQVGQEKVNEKLLELQSLSATEKSCFQLALQGIKKSGRYLLDPDGHHLNHPPIEVECKFPSNLTLIGEKFEKEFEKCNSSKCSEVPVEYNAHIDQILRLIEDSGSCSQELQFHCNNAPLRTVSQHYFFRHSIIFQTDNFQVFHVMILEFFIV